MKSAPYLSIRSLERRLSVGTTETLTFEPGVNLIIGKPNTGKTKWLDTIDYLFGGDTPPFDGDDSLSSKYDAASATVCIENDTFLIERRWREPGAKNKIFVGKDSFTAQASQDFLLEKLRIPILHFPRGNPMSGQTWPELSFRILLRHIYRRQLFWGDIADRQPEAEQHAALLQFLGLAETIFNADYGELIRLRMELEHLRARRDQYDQTLKELAGEVLTEPTLQTSISLSNVLAATQKMTEEFDVLQHQRDAVLSRTRDEVVAPDQLAHIEQLGASRATLATQLEDLQKQENAIADRGKELNGYQADLKEEINRIERTHDAGEVLSDLKITHCPACDQPISSSYSGQDCFLCHQSMPEPSIVEGLGEARLQFERQRLAAELEEATELVRVIEQDAKRIRSQIREAQEQLRMIDSELKPTRSAVSALAQDSVSAIDVAIGELIERERQIGRLKRALEIGQALTEQANVIEKQIEPLQTKVNDNLRAADFGEAEILMADGMNEYLQAINRLKDGAWPHNPVSVDISRWGFQIKVGSRRWSKVLGGTDTLYFLMAYQYGLLTLSNKSGRHYPGLSIIDVPGEFSGEAIEDKENFIVQPFIDLLARDSFQGAQAVITGAAFTGLEGAHQIHLTHVFVA